MLLDKINRPSDLDSLSIEELKTLSEELRETLLFTLGNKGGHSGPNLAVVELTLAIHKVFDAPVDKIIFDISHQTYTHKMLTGRKAAFLNKDKHNMVSGFSSPSESIYDLFTIGHTSTSVSLAHGLAKSRDLKGTNEKIVAVIGDGSLSGGLALAGLSNVGELNSNLIIIVNDNDQSIAENHGGLYENLRNLRMYNGEYHTNLFTAMGLDYYYVSEGHNLEQLINVLTQVKDCQKPVVVHVQTTKGKGYAPAEKNKEMFHVGGAIDLNHGVYKQVDFNPSYKTKIREQLCLAMEKDQDVSVVVAGTPNMLGFTSEIRTKFSKQFIDTGIAEEHAVTMVCAMAKRNLKPVMAVASTFIQRGYDQLSHDLGLNNSPAAIVVCHTGIDASKEASHLGLFDIPMMSNIPNLTYLAPTCVEEQQAMLEYAINQNNGPLAIRMPMGELQYKGIHDGTDYSKTNKFQLSSMGEEVAIIGVGTFFNLAKEVEAGLIENHSIKPTLVNPKFISGIDTELLDQLARTHKLIITLEDGQVEGGFGYKVVNYLSDKEVKAKAFGFNKEFLNRFDKEEVLKANNLLPEQIVEYIMSIV
ncbi:1-deoxy-D-xylulose-5-phosphate synthase [Mollicutes bacterium LVI A0039]|nr:1-deoxy-D-xylulose-5-phosphate synthase [Mollicutes bacterium LVI A0039]